MWLKCLHFVSQKSLDRKCNISLRASNGDEQEGLTLSISLPPTYPKTLPRLAVGFGSEIRQKAKTQVEEVVKSKPKTLLGSEMIYEIASSIQDILDATWTNPKETITLDEERAAREQAAKLKSLQLEEDQRRREIEAQREEEQSLQLLVDQRQTQTIERNLKASPTPRDDDPDRIGIDFERPTHVREPNGRAVALQSVHSRVKYNSSPICELFTVQVKAQTYGEIAPQEEPYLVLKECQFSPTNGEEASTKRFVQNLESKLEFHLGLDSHQSITKPLNFRIQRSSSDWIVSVLMEKAERKSLWETLDVVDKLDIKLVRAWSIQLIEGLQYYHRHGCAHANVHLSNILLRRDLEAERENRRITVATLSDGGYERDLHILKNGAGPNYFPIPWTAPELVNASLLDTPLPATDIWDFGRCFLMAAFGLGVLSEFPSGPTPMIEELRLTSSLKALLSKVFNNNPKKRPSAWDLLHYEFFRNEDLLFDEKPSREINSVEASSLSLSSHLARSRRESVPTSLSSSRYNKDFVEDGRLGKGGFGEVFRARNKVDGQPYAIKKVKARSKAALDPVLSEVTVLSRLNHPNVVRYFASWIEDQVPMDEDENSDSSGDEYTSSMTDTGYRSNLPASSRGLDFISSTNAQIVFGNDHESGESSEDENDDGIDSEENDNNMIGTMTRARDSLPDSSSMGNASPSGAVQKASWTLLYIQVRKPASRYSAETE